jgi:D-glycero-D-manno-heptose 1,7-bisphosphate phosphatase
MLSIISLLKAIFLDRDGTILKEIPAIDQNNRETFGYITDISQVELINGAADAIAFGRKLGFKIIIISNQSAIARGWITEKQLQIINLEMYRQLKESNSSAIIDDFFFSPYHPEGAVEKYKKDSPMRKPGIGMVLKAQKKYDLYLPGSYLIGDAYSDMKCAENAGLKKILVLSGYGKKTSKICFEEGLQVDFIANNLFEAVKFIENSQY